MLPMSEAAAVGVAGSLQPDRTKFRLLKGGRGSELLPRVSEFAPGTIVALPGLHREREKVEMERKCMVGIQGRA